MVNYFVPLQPLMNTKTKRRLYARLLLSVFLPMLLLSSLHVHTATPVAVGTCVDCVNHMPHAGHISLNTLDVHDCVLCQFTSLPFIVAVAVVAAVAAWAYAVVTSLPLARLLSAADSPLIPRAPPVF